MVYKFQRTLIKQGLIMQDKESFDLEHFGVSPERGFLPEPDPLTELPAGLEFLDDVGNRLPELIESKEILTVAGALPVLPGGYFARLNRRELMLAWVRCSHILNGYVHSQTGPKIVPKSLAGTSCAIAQELRVPPILQYFPYVLYNWKRKDPGGPIRVDNLELIQMFLRIPEQSWFNLVHVDIENEAGVAIAGMWDVQWCVSHGYASILDYELVQIQESIGRMIVSMKRMPEGTFPDTYYKIRPWIWSFEEVVFEGVDEYGGQLRNFRGQTGAQTPIFQSLEAGLQMPKLSENKLSIHLLDMRNYMLPSHREFIEYLEANSKVRDFVVSSAPRLSDFYDGCVEKTLEFLAIHLGYAFFYIHKQTDNPRGTGDVPDFMEYLGERIEERWKVAFIKPRTETDFKKFMYDMRKVVKELVRA